jgi:hypothetical protein
MAARPRTIRSNALRLACWNVDGFRGRKLELDSSSVKTVLIFAF